MRKYTNCKCGKVVRKDGTGICMKCAGLIRRSNPIKRFFEYVKKTSTCWIWIGNKMNEGYGQFGVDYKMKRSHRYAWEIFKGDIPQGLNVCHSCDNRACVNPAHLWLGTQKDNVSDCIKKGRRVKALGEKCGSHKLTESQVLEIRKIGSKMTYEEIAIKFNIFHKTVYQIIKRLTWKHI